MRFVKIVDDNGTCYLNPSLVTFVGDSREDGTDVFFAGDGSPATLVGITPDEVAAAIERQAEPEPEPTTISSPPAPSDPPALAPRQVWTSEDGEPRAHVHSVGPDGLVAYRFRGHAALPLGPDLFRASPGSFRRMFPRLVPDADDPQSPPITTPHDPVARLAEGARLRFVRDADGLNLPSEADVAVWGPAADGVYRGAVRRAGGASTVACSAGSDIKHQAAEYTMELLARLGYRLDPVAGDAG